MDEVSLTPGNPSNSSAIDPPCRVVCHVCCKQFSHYTCPRCNTRYCSLPCYKSHSARCTESFMRENVLEEMKLMQPDEGTRRKTLEMLKRVYSEEEEADTIDEEDFCLSEETVNKILSGIDVSFDDLTVEEKKEFQRAVASGRLGKMIEPWEPWWLKPSAKTITLSKDGTQLVKPISDEDNSLTSNYEVRDKIREIPPGPEDPLSSVRKLSSMEPSPLLPVHLVDIIYSYCFALRIYNGDWSSDAAGSAIVVLSISSVVNQAAQPETIMEALSYNLEQTCSPVFKQMGGLPLGLRTVDDVIMLLSLGSSALVCALCDLQRMMRDGVMELKAEKPKASRGSEVRNKLKHADKKIYFLMCWVHEQPQEAWTSLATMVETEKSSLASYSTGEVVNNKVKERGKIVIEEIK